MIEEARPNIQSLAGATVLQVAPSLRDDRVGRGVLDIATGLLRSGARALVAGGSGRLVGELQAVGGEWIELDLSSRALRQRKSVSKLGPILHAEGIDLIHAHGPDASRIALAANQSTSIPLLTSYLGAPPGPSWRTPPQDAQARGHLVAAVSEFSALAIASRHHIVPEKTVVIPRAVETGWFDPAAVDSGRVAALRETWRIRPEARAILLPGPLAPSQGHLTFIDAARILVNGGLRGVVFIIAAARVDNPDYASLVNQRIEAQGLGPLFRRVGHCEDMPAAYAAVDIVALPLERASIFSRTAAEAQAMAKPVVATDIGAMPEILQAPPLGIQGARTGWLAPPADALAFARGLAAALALSPEEFDGVARQARNRVQQIYSPERVAAATLATYLSMLQEP